MSTIEKIKRVFLIALGFGLATYLIMSGFAILNKEEQLDKAPKEIATD
ncbi:MAG: hypothetical protein J7J31_02755 [Helicobacteraceae bacterium]|nr:hypothetical protein [Helicobacteraceae bacterium]